MRPLLAGDAVAVPVQLAGVARLTGLDQRGTGGPNRVTVGVDHLRSRRWSGDGDGDVTHHGLVRGRQPGRSARPRRRARAAPETAGAGPRPSSCASALSRGSAGCAGLSAVGAGLAQRGPAVMDAATSFAGLIPALVDGGVGRTAVGRLWRHYVVRCRSHSSWHSHPSFEPYGQPARILSSPQSSYCAEPG